MLGRVSSSPSALGRSAQQAPGLNWEMGSGLAGSGAGLDSPSPRRPGQGGGRFTPSHRHTGRLVPKAVDHIVLIDSLDKRKGEGGRLADRGLWRIFEHAAMGVTLLCYQVN